MIKVNDLTGERLAYWVAKTRGWRKRCNSMLRNYWDKGEGRPTGIFMSDYRPDINGGQAMELVKEFKAFNLSKQTTGKWMVLYGEGGVFIFGPTPEIAICRAFVASVYGDEVEDE